MMKLFKIIHTYTLYTFHIYLIVSNICFCGKFLLIQDLKDKNETKFLRTFFPETYFYRFHIVGKGISIFNKEI